MRHDIRHFAPLCAILLGHIANSPSLPRPAHQPLPLPIHVLLDELDILLGEVVGSLYLPAGRAAWCVHAASLRPTLRPIGSRYAPSDRAIAFLRQSTIPRQSRSEQ